MPNITAVVIDDEKDLVEIFSEFLEINGVNVVGIGYNGKDALDLYKKYRPDLIFTDLMMPDYDGLYALERIRIIDPASKIIVITAVLKDILL